MGKRLGKRQGEESIFLVFFLLSSFLFCKIDIFESLFEKVGDFGRHIDNVGDSCLFGVGGLFRE